MKAGDRLDSGAISEGNSLSTVIMTERTTARGEQD